MEEISWKSLQVLNCSLDHFCKRSGLVNLSNLVYALLGFLNSRNYACQESLFINSMTTASRSKLIAYLGLGIGILSLGFSAIFVSWSNAPGTVATFYRMVFGSLLVLPLFLFNQHKRRSKPSKRALWLGVLAGLFFALDLGLWSTGVVISGATNPTLMANTAPLWVGLGSVLIFHERKRSLFWFGTLLAIFGAVVVLGVDLSRSENFALGTLLGLLGAIFYGAYFLTAQRAREGLNTFAFYMVATPSAAFFLLVSIILLKQPLVGYPPLTWLNFLALGVIVQFIGWLSINYTQGYLPATIVSPTMLGQPVVTALLAIPLLGESLTLWQALGGIAVLAGVYLVHRSQHH